jgi:hypothetical protein
MEEILTKLYMQINYPKSRRTGISGGLAEQRFNLDKPTKSKISSSAKSEGSWLSGLAAELPPLMATGAARQAFNDLNKIISHATQNGPLSSDLEERIKVIQAVAILIMTAKGGNLLGLKPKADDDKAVPVRNKPILVVNGEEMTFDGYLHLDLARHKVTVEGNFVYLTRKEFELLATLAKRRGLVQSRERLLNEVWDYHCVLNTRTVDTHVRRLRQKLGPARKYIETVIGIGYRFLEN